MRALVGSSVAAIAVSLVAVPAAPAAASGSCSADVLTRHWSASPTAQVHAHHVVATANGGSLRYAPAAGWRLVSSNTTWRRSGHPDVVSADNANAGGNAGVQGPKGYYLAALTVRASTCGQPQPAYLDLVTVRHVASGADFDVLGQSGYARVRVVVQRRASSSAAWQTLTSATTGSDGHWSATASQAGGQHAQYRAVVTRSGEVDRTPAVTVTS